MTETTTPTDPITQLAAQEQERRRRRKEVTTFTRLVEEVETTRRLLRNMGLRGGEVFVVPGSRPRAGLTQRGLFFTPVPGTGNELGLVVHEQGSTVGVKTVGDVAARRDQAATPQGATSPGHGWTWLQRWVWLNNRVTDPLDIMPTVLFGSAFVLLAPGMVTLPLHASGLLPGGWAAALHGILVIALCACLPGLERRIEARLLAAGHALLESRPSGSGAPEG